MERYYVILYAFKNAHDGRWYAERVFTSLAEAQEHMRQMESIHPDLVYSCSDVNLWQLLNRFADE